MDSSKLNEEPVECEWCCDRASFKIQDGDYRRYACGDVQHRETLRTLAVLDGHNHYAVILGYFTKGGEDV